MSGHLPPITPVIRHRLPSMGLWGGVPPLRRTMQCSDSLPPIRSRFGCLAWPYRAGLLFRSPARASAPAGVWPLFNRWPSRIRRGDVRASWVPGELNARSPALRPRGERCPLPRSASLAASAFSTASPPRKTGLRRSITRLRGPLYDAFAAPVTRTPRNNSVPLLLGFAGRVRLAGSARGFRYVHSLPSSKLPQRTRIQLYFSSFWSIRSLVCCEAGTLRSKGCSSFADTVAGGCWFLLTTMLHPSSFAASLGKHPSRAAKAASLWRRPCKNGRKDHRMEWIIFATTGVYTHPRRNI